jgi:uncharacterized protein (DUF1499 family)
MQRSRLAVVCGFLGALGVFDAVLGPVLIHAGAVTPFFGFRAFFVLGLLCGLIALLLSPFALRATRASAGRSGRGLAWLGFACGALLVGVVAAGARGGAGVPAINDITTDLADPPAFASDPAELGRDMAYPADFVPQVQKAYPDLATLRVASEPAQALALSEQAAKALGWEVVAVDAAAGTLLARQTTRVFRFVDDVIVRVRPAEGGGALVDVRSKSRDGRGDMGVNAARIRAFAEKLPR